MKVKGDYFLDECGMLEEGEINDLLNTAVLSVKNMEVISWQGRKIVCVRTV